MEVFAVILLVLGLGALAIWSKHLRDAKQMQIHKIIHEERMRAMEKGIPIEDLNNEGMARALAQMTEGARIPGSDPKSNIMWIRVSALCLGLLFLMGGIGVAAGFPLVGDAEIQMMWSIGFIPALIGFGLLLFYGLSRRYE
jgi:hypothetical protein